MSLKNYVHLVERTKYVVFLGIFLVIEYIMLKITGICLNIEDWYVQTNRINFLNYIKQFFIGSHYDWIFGENNATDKKCRMVFGSIRFGQVEK